MNRAEKTAGWTAGEGRWAGGGEERCRQGEAREAPQVRAPGLAWVTEVQRNPGEGGTHGIQSLSTPRPLSGTALGYNTQEPWTLENQTNRNGPPEATATSSPRGRRFPKSRLRFLPPSPHRGFPPRPAAVRLGSLLPAGVSPAEATNDLPRYLSRQALVSGLRLTPLVARAERALPESLSCLGLCGTVFS